MRPLFLQRLEATYGTKMGFITEASRAATPYVVDCYGLNDEDLGWERYVQELQDRQEWCKERCPSDHLIEPLRLDGRLVGRQFRFAREEDAALFKMFFV